MSARDTPRVVDALPSNRAEPSPVAVVKLTASGDAADAERGFASGAKKRLAAPRERHAPRRHNAALRAVLARRLEQNERVQTVCLRALAHLAETRDAETGHHLLRTQAYVALLAKDLQSHPSHAALLTPRYIRLLVRSAPLHDIGKVGIPDRILLKPSKLDPNEWAVMKTHAALGARAIEQAEHDAEHAVDFLRLAKEIAHWHHERWDGSGYPDGLAGEAIPLSARLMALADVFDALVSARTYKAPMSCDRARRIILDGRGTHFDPDVVDAFVRQFAAFADVAGRYADVDTATVVAAA